MLVRDVVLEADDEEELGWCVDEDDEDDDSGPELDSLRLALRPPDEDDDEADDEAEEEDAVLEGVGMHCLSRAVPTWLALGND